jgi:hypothetical protein
MLDLAHIDEELALAYLGRFQIQSWRRITSGGLRLAQTTAARHQRGLGEQKLCALAVTSAHIEFPDQATRDVASQFSHRLAEHHIASATVIEGEGFRASAARAAYAGILLFARSPVPHKAFATVEQAADWLTDRVNLPPGERFELVTAAHELRQRHLAFTGAP